MRKSSCFFINICYICKYAIINKYMTNTILTLFYEVIFTFSDFYQTTSVQDKKKIVHVCAKRAVINCLFRRIDNGVFLVDCRVICGVCMFNVLSRWVINFQENIKYQLQHLCKKRNVQTRGIYCYNISQFLYNTKVSLY